MSEVKLLLIDDQPENEAALREILKESDYQLVNAKSGRDALGKLLRDEFALILLGLVIRGLDSFELATLIKSRQKNRKIPLIFLTALTNDVQEVHRAYEVGAVDCIPSPLDAAIVRAKVEIFVELYRKNREIQRQSELLRRTAREAGEKKFQDLAEGIDHGIVWSADPRTFTFSYVSPRAEPLLGYPVEQWFSEHGFWMNHLLPDDRKKVLLKIEEAREGKETTVDHRFFTSTGDLIWFHTALRLARKGEGEGLEIRGISVDISRLKRVEEILRESVRKREEFLSIASHELKAPLAPIKLQIQTLGRALDKSDVSKIQPEIVKKSIAVLDRQINRFSLLIENLLDVSKIGVGMMSLFRDKINLSALVHEVVERYSDQISKAHCEVVILDDPVIFGEWDRVRIEQVLVNLLTNALKFGAGKPIEIQLASQEGVGIIRVRDHGIGIKREDQQRIFRRFERAATGRNVPGLGLGLYITQQIVQEHGGKIRVESEPDKGSTFIVELPLLAQAQKVEKKEDSAA